MHHYHDGQKWVFTDSDSTTALGLGVGGGVAGAGGMWVTGAGGMWVAQPEPYTHHSHTVFPVVFPVIDGYAVNPYTFAVRGFLTGIVLMMKRAEILSYRISTDELYAYANSLVAISAQPNISLFNQAMVMIDTLVDVHALRGAQILSADDDVRIYARCEAADVRYILVKIMQPGEEGARAMAQVTDGKLQEQETA